MEPEHDPFSNLASLEESLKMLTKTAIAKGIDLENDATLRALMATFVELKNDLQNFVEQGESQTNRDGD